MSKNSNSTGKRTSETRELSPQKRVKQAKAKLEELRNAAPPPPRSGEPHPATVACEEMGRVRESIGEIPVPMTLKEICFLIGPDCRPEDFAATAIEALAGQLFAVAQLAERDGSFEGFCVIENIVDRMKCAGEVVRWLESETTELPEVAP